jgi:hypothetical protein
MPPPQPSDKTELQKTLDEALLELRTYDIGDEQYPKALALVERLHKLSPPKAEPLSPNTMLLVAGNLLGIALILGYERTHIVTSKALSFVLRAR